MLTLWLIKRLDPDWMVAHKLWSIRLQLFWAGLSGLWVAWPSFQGFLPPIWFALSCIIFSIVIMVARLTKQPGLE